MSHSILEELQRTNASIFIAKGSEDGTDVSAEMDLLQASLVSKGKNVLAYVIEGADHGFQFPADKARDGWAEILGRVSNWFVEKPVP